MDHVKCQGLGSDPGSVTLKQRDDLFRLFVERVKDYAIFLLDTDGCVISWNPGAEAFKGYRAEEILGRSFEVFYPEEDRRAGKPHRLLEEARKNGRVEEEGWRVRKDGGRFWADVVITAVVDATDHLVGYAKITRDLTERRRIEEELRRSQQTLEERVLDRTAQLQDRNRDLEQLHDVTVGRELRMMELEREIEGLRQEVAILKRIRS